MKQQSPDATIFFFFFFFGCTFVLSKGSRIRVATTSPTSHD